MDPNLQTTSGTPSAPKPPAGAGASQAVPAGNSYADEHCDVCGAPIGKHHLSYCDLRGDV